VPVGPPLHAATRSMSVAFFAVAIFVTIVAPALVVTRLLREKFKAERRLARTEHVAAPRTHASCREWRKTWMPAASPPLPRT
jgi:hypothetical protein